VLIACCTIAVFGLGAGPVPFFLLLVWLFGWATSGHRRRIDASHPRAVRIDETFPHSCVTVRHLGEPPPSDR
jgi:hypothetical protein